MIASAVQRVNRLSLKPAGSNGAYRFTTLVLSRPDDAQHSEANPTGD